MFNDDIYIYAMDIIIMALVLLPNPKMGFIGKDLLCQILIQLFAISLKFEQYQSNIVLRSLKHLVLACVAFCFLTA